MNGYQMKVTNKLKLQEIDGLYMIPGFFSVENFRATVNLRLEPGDVVVSTFPKCGTTWMQYIVWEIINDASEEQPTVHEMNNAVFPFLEINGVELLKDRPHPWYLKVHLPYSYTPHHPEAKYIYVARNPKDCCVSFFPFLKQGSDVAVPERMTFREFFENFIEGHVPWGDPLDHVLSWYEHKDDPNVLFLTYEEMQEDPKKAILDVARFLGEEHYKKLMEDEAMLNKILELTSFGYMKKLPYVIPANEEVAKESGLLPSNEEIEANPDKFIKLDFFRKGAVGDWANYFDEEMNQLMEEYMERKLKSTHLYDLWRNA